MQKLLLVFAFFLSNIVLTFSQKQVDIIHLKDGGKIIGHVIEKTPEKIIKIQTLDGSIYEFPFLEIEKITKEINSVNLEEYGGKTSMGVALSSSILDLGINFGMPIRYYFTPKNAVEFGIYARDIQHIKQRYNEINSSGIVLSVGTVAYFRKRYKAHKNKVKQNGISLMVGYAATQYPEFLSSFAWVTETFRKKNKSKSFIFELGIGLNSFIATETNSRYITGESYFLPGIFWKCYWNFYTKRINK